MLSETSVWHLALWPRGRAAWCATPTEAAPVFGGVVSFATRTALPRRTSACAVAASAASRAAPSQAGLAAMVRRYRAKLEDRH